MKSVVAAVLAFALLGLAGASQRAPDLKFPLVERSAPVLLVQRDVGQCMGACASEQGICIGQCQGNGQCIGQCAAAHGRCVSRCN